MGIIPYPLDNPGIFSRTFCGAAKQFVYCQHGNKWIDLMKLNDFHTAGIALHFVDRCLNGSVNRWGRHGKQVACFGIACQTDIELTGQHRLQY